MLEYIYAPEAAKNGASSNGAYRNCAKKTTYPALQNSAVCG